MGRQLCRYILKVQQQKGHIYSAAGVIFCNNPKAGVKNTIGFFVKGTNVILTSGLAYKITPHPICKSHAKLLLFVESLNTL